MLSISFWLAFGTVFVLLMKAGDIGASMKSPRFRRVSLAPARRAVTVARAGEPEPARTEALERAA